MINNKYCGTGLNYCTTAHSYFYLYLPNTKYEQRENCSIPSPSQTQRGSDTKSQVQVRLASLYVKAKSVMKIIINY